MLKIGKLADYALVLAEYLGSTGRIVAISELSQETHIPLATVRKILLRLSQNGIVYSYRGVNGGYELAKAASSITVVEILEAMEGPLSITECVSTGSECKISKYCNLQRGWCSINEKIFSILSRTSLFDL